MSLEDAFSAPETFDSNLFESPYQTALFDESDSDAAGRQRSIDHSTQLADSATSPEADVCTVSVAEQHTNADNQYRRLSTDEVITVTTHSQDVAVSESESIVDKVQLSRKLETGHLSQLVKVDEDRISEESAMEHTLRAEFGACALHGDQQITLSDSSAGTKLIVPDEPEEQMLVSCDESEQAFTLSVKDMSENRVVSDQGEDKRQEIGLTEAALLEEQPVELTFSEVAEVCEETFKTSDRVSDKEAADVQDPSFAVCSEEPPAQKLEVQPVDWPALTDVALNAVVGDVSPQLLTQDDVNATHAVSCVESRDYEFPVEELVTYDVRMPEIDAVHLEISESGNIAATSVNLPDSECGVQELVVSEFGNFVVHFESPETATLRAVEITTVPYHTITVSPVVEAVETEVSTRSSTEPEMTTVDVRLSAMAKLPVTDTQSGETILKSDETIHYEASALSEPGLETYVELEELLEAESAKVPEASLSVMCKYTVDDGRVCSLDRDGEMPTVAAKFSDNYIETDTVKYLTEEDVPLRTHVDIAEEMKSAALEVDYHPTDSEDEDDTETVTSDEWSVLEKELDAAFGMKLSEDLIYEQVPDYDVDASRLAKELVYDSSTDETSTEYDTKTTSCTSSVVHTD